MWTIYDTLQACASISVSRLYNFHLPYLVTFANTLFFCFVPKYLGTRILTQNFVNICLFVSWRRPQFLLFYLNFLPLLHQKYMKILNKAFPQSCRYGKYFSFATLDNPVTVLGAEQFVFPCQKLFPQFQLKKFWAWAETKTGFCWGRIRGKAFHEFQANWIFNRATTKKFKKNHFYRFSHKL